MGAVRYRLRHRLRSHGREAAVLAVGVAVMAGVVLTLTAGATRTASAPDRYDDAHGGVYAASIEQEGPPRDDEVRALPAVERFDAASFVFGGLLPLGGTFEDLIQDVNIFSGVSDAFDTEVVEGREPQRPDEFAAAPSFLEAAGAHVGDRFTLITIRQEPATESGFDADIDGPTETATLVGVIDGPVQIDDPTPFALFPPSLHEIGDVGVAATFGSVVLAPGATVEDLRTQLDALPEGETFFLGDVELVSSNLRRAVSAQAQGIALVAAIAATATIVVVGQLLTRQVRLGEADRRVLLSMGMTPRHVVLDQLLAAAVPVVVGTVVATGLGWLASDIFPYGFVDRVEPSPGRRFDAPVHVLGAVALATLVLAWVLGALVLSTRRRAHPTTPGVVDAVATRVPARAATAVRFAFTRTARESTGPRGPVLGMVVLLVVLVGALTFGASLRHLVDEGRYWGGNFDVQLGQGGDSFPEEALAELQSDPDVTAFSLTTSNTVGVVGSADVNMTVMDPVKGSVTPEILDGRLPRGDDEVAIGRVAADDRGLAIGDDLVVTSGGAEHVLTITGIAVVPTVEGADGVGQDAVLASIEALQQIVPDAQARGAVVRLGPGVDRQTFIDSFRARTQMDGSGPDTPGVIVNVERVTSIPYLVAGTLGLLALLSLFHQLIVTTQRRRRDLAVLRALGADSRWVTGVVHWQATVFTVVVLAIGTPLGIVAGRLVYHAFVDRIGARNTVDAPLALFALALAGLLVLANVVAAPNARTARRRSPAAALAAE